MLMLEHVKCVWFQNVAVLEGAKTQLHIDF
jgi:hypothetical protein